ncbi:tetratricopeptide repeat protein [Siccationidurans soli]|uniref:Tetratricopeptide repeat protein n=1 Tax=Hymenobacter negativus TaxID=2795026 RepID=A0ABS3QFF2_9BACT|nr:tetratricopeptide repeat protein [Hymenobacter negativus]
MSRFLGLLFLLWLLAAGFPSRAESICPWLSPRQADSLRRQLQNSRPDTNRVKALLQLSQNLVTQFDEVESELGPALPYAKQAAQLSEALHFEAGRIGSLYILGQIRHYTDHMAAADSLFRRGIALSQRVGNHRLEGFGWFWLGDMYEQTDPTKLAYWQRARQLFRQARDKVDEAYTLKTIADVHQGQGHPEQAIRELLEVESLYRATGHRKLLYTYDLLAATYRQLGDYKEALRYSKAALDNAQAVHDTIIIGSLYVRLALVHRELTQYPDALVYYRKALANMQQSGSSMNVVTIAGGIVRILVVQHRAPEALAFFTRTTRTYASDNPRVIERIADYMVELHCALGHPALAEPYARQMVAFLNTGTADKSERTSIYLTLGKFYLLTRRYELARQYLRQGEELNRAGGSVLYLAQMHLLLFKADSAQARFPAALAHYQRYKLLTDSVFNERKAKQLASLEIQYDTRKKEQNIALLTHQTQVQQASLRQRDFQRNTLVIGTLLLLALLGLGYNRYRLKQRAARLLEAKQAEINHKNQSLQHLLVEKDWMLKEIHHRVKNNLEVISSLLETQADYLRDPAALAALRESQNRVHAMALIHQKLYQSHNMAVVNMASYIREIAEHLLDSFDCQSTVRLNFALTPIALDVTIATPLGLLLNEALTNALKYAHPYPQPGRLRIELSEVGFQRFRLIIEDDGPGFPPGFELENNSTMGLTIMRGLSQQLDGALSITQTPGVRICLDFQAVASAALV